MCFLISVSYTILNLSPSILCLAIMLLIPCTFPPIPILSLPTDNPPCDLQFCDSVPVLAVCLVWVFFCFLGSVVDSYEFVVMLTSQAALIITSFFFLIKMPYGVAFLD